MFFVGDVVIGYIGYSGIEWMWGFVDVIVFVFVVLWVMLVMVWD